MPFQGCHVAAASPRLPALDCQPQTARQEALAVQPGGLLMAIFGNAVHGPSTFNISPHQLLLPLAMFVFVCFIRFFLPLQDCRNQQQQQRYLCCHHHRHRHHHTAMMCPLRRNSPYSIYATLGSLTSIPLFLTLSVSNPDLRRTICGRKLFQSYVTQVLQRPAGVPAC